MNFEAILNFITSRSDELPNTVRGTFRLTAEESLQIYRTDFLARLQGALAEHFPMTWQVLGDKSFFTVAKAYVLQNASASWDINGYGEHFPHFLSSFQDLDFNQRLPFLGDLAALEWASHQFFHEAPLINLKEPATLTERDLGELTLSPSLKLFSSSFQIPDIYRAAQSAESEMPSHWQTPSYYFLSKNNFLVQLQDLNKTQFFILSKWQQWGSLEKAIDAINDSLNDNDPILHELGPLIHRMHLLGFVF